MPEFPGIEKDTYKGANPETARGLTYDMLAEIIQHLKASDKRFKKLEKKRVFDTSVSAITGLIGGAAAFVMSKLFMKG